MMFTTIMKILSIYDKEKTERKNGYFSGIGTSDFEDMALCTSISL